MNRTIQRVRAVECLCVVARVRTPGVCGVRGLRGRRLALVCWDSLRGQAPQTKYLIGVVAGPGLIVSFIS